MTKEDNEDFENTTECWICDNYYTDGDVKVRGRCHISKKYRVFVHRDCNINVKLNQKISIGFHNLKIMIHILLYKNKGNSVLK